MSDDVKALQSKYDELSAQHEQAGREADEHQKRAKELRTIQLKTQEGMNAIRLELRNVQTVAAQRQAADSAAQCLAKCREASTNIESVLADFNAKAGALLKRFETAVAEVERKSVE